MTQKLIQTQEQKLIQTQRLSQQQMLQVRLLEMPLTELEESINTELDDNPALEVLMPDEQSPEEKEESTAEDNEDFEQQQEREERETELDNALENIGRDDEMPTPRQQAPFDDADYEEIVYGDTVSFYDKLKEQMGENELTEQQREIMEYLIGSLDDDGLLRKDTDTIADELAIYHNIEASPDDIEQTVRLLQTFDPPGIGARTLQECLLLQIARKPEGRLRDIMESIISHHFDEFTKKHWQKIQSALALNDAQTDAVRSEIRKLNPKPGSSLGETEGRNLQQITPDFVVETNDDGSITFYINTGNIPELKVSASFTDMLETYRNNRKGMSRQEKEALLYAKEKVERAQGFIEAVKQRRRTLYITMKAIIDWQKRFFQDGDEAELRPMILKDIADKTGLDISTISRVSNVKYAQTNWGTFPLRFFFSDGYNTANGEQLSTRKMKVTLRELIQQEDKSKPLSDDALTAMMNKLGYPIARRTVAKYREQLGLPVARLRKC